MKPRFSLDDALAAPFSLLRRRPLHLFVWGLPLIAVLAAIYSLMIPALAAMSVEAGRMDVAPETYVIEAMRLQAALQALNLVMYLIFLVVWTAAARAVLSPGRGDRFLFLRLGMDEVRVAVTIVAVLLCWYIALLLLVLLGVGLGVALWSADRPVLIGVLSVYGLLVLIASVWVLIRASLIAPASLILKRFAFAEGWAITRGQVWKLIGLNLVLWVIQMLGSILFYALAGGILVVGFFAQGLVWPESVDTLSDLYPIARPMLVPALLTLVPVSLGFGWMTALYAAPHVRAAHQLLGGVPVIDPVAIARDGSPSDGLQGS